MRWSSEKDKAFRRIMGAMDMPQDSDPDYDEWLFNVSWDAAREGYDEIYQKYTELLLQVGKKWPGESRHQTAVRYLIEAENIPDTGAKST